MIETRQLPRLVDQLRILLWFQMHLSLIGLIVVFVWAYFVDKQRQITFDSALRAQVSRTENRLFLTMGALILVAVLLAICAKLLWRGWKWVYLAGLDGALLVLLYAALTGWILVDLFRGEVRAYVWRRR